MDKQGNIYSPEEVQQRLGELTGTEDVPRKHSPDEQRKVSLSEYLSSPEFQRQQKIASEQAQRSEFERRMAFGQRGTESDQSQAETETRSEGAVMKGSQSAIVGCR